ncbi:MAG: methylated-DNA--[protein]-cysteine S-methyltransferase, partial [Sphingomonadales bacterium]
MPQLSLHSPVGDLTVHEHGGAIVSLDWGWVPDQQETPLLVRARDRLQAYFDGDTGPFDLPLDPPGTAFQKRVWAALTLIPAGTVRTYGELAREIGSQPRAAGMGCARNPLPILIPCHRV